VFFTSDVIFQSDPVHLIFIFWFTTLAKVINDATKLSGYLILHIQEFQHEGERREPWKLNGAIFIVIFGGRLIHDTR
jgi:hypothetical protein